MNQIEEAKLDPLEIVVFLGSLVDKSLVTFENGRYSMLQSVRDYGRERLFAEADFEHRLRRHAQYCVSLLEGCDDGLSGPEQTAWVKLLDRELDNLRAAISSMLTIADSEALDIARTIVTSTWKFWSWKALSAEALGYLNRATQDERGDPAGLAAAFSVAGVLATYRGDNADAGDFLERALALRRELGDKQALARTLNNKGLLCVNTGEFDIGRRCFTEALELIRDAGPSYAYATMLLNLGNLETYVGDQDAAQEAYQECRDVFASVGDSEGEALALFNLAILAWDKGEYQAAEELRLLALPVFERVGNVRMVAWTYSAQGTARLLEGNVEAARALVTKSVDISLASGERMGIALALLAWAGILDHEADYRGVATILGCFDVQRQEIDMALTPGQVGDNVGFESRARAALGQEAYEDHFSRGAGFSPEELLPTRRAARLSEER